MKINQIVGEVKKDYRAKVYTIKTPKAKTATTPDKSTNYVKKHGEEAPKKAKTVKEDDAMKIKSVSGNDVTIDQGGQEIKTTTDALAPGQQPGTFTMKAPDPSKITPGATVTTDTQTSEEYHDAHDYSAHQSGQHDVGGDATDDFINDVKDHQFREDGLGTVPTTDFVKGIYDVAAQYGSEAPNPEEIKKLMVLAPNGEVDMEQTFKKVMTVFQDALPKIEQIVKDMEEVIKKGEESGQIPAGTLAAANQQVQAQTAVKESDDALLQKMLSIAGLR